MTDRCILRLTGADTRDFLQGLVTNDVTGLDDGLVYAALLTPQGKYMADFFLVPDGDAVLLDVAAELGPMLMQRLTLYKLRADVQIELTKLHLHRGLKATPEDGWPDPRHAALGWRAYRDAPPTQDRTDWTALRITHLIPETGIELHENTFILEAGFERLNGVDFRKGCYVGQEVTARMKHKTELRKGLRRVTVSGPAAPGSEITSTGKSAGLLHSVENGAGIAYLRFDRIGPDMRAGAAQITPLDD